MSFVRRFVRDYLECGATQYGGMLAYSLFVSLIPLVLGLLSIFSLISRNPRRFSGVRQLFVEIFPPDVQAPVRDALLAASQHAWTVVLLSVISLAWFSSGLFSTTGFALNQIYHHPNRSFWRQRLLGLWLPVALILAFALVIAFEISVRLLHLPRPAALVGVWVTLAALILFIYRRAPGRTLARSQLWPGAALAAFAIVIFGYGLTLTANLTLQLSPDTRFFAQVFALAAWTYFIAQAILFGAVLNRSLSTSVRRS